jgi:hypothetical protein
MKEAYAVRRTVPPLAEIQASIDKLLSRGMVDDPQKMLSELARLGARLIIQRAVEDEFDSWLGRARYERRPERQRGLRNGFRPRHLQTAEVSCGCWLPLRRQCSHETETAACVEGSHADEADVSERWTSERFGPSIQECGAGGRPVS